MKRLTTASLADTSRSLSRMDNAVAAYARRHGRVPSVKSRVERLEAMVLETHSATDLAALDAYAAELYSCARGLKDE